MRHVLLVRYGEVYLKGQNRPFFLKKLLENVRAAVKPLGATAFLSDARIYVGGAEDLNACLLQVKKVFGVHSISPAFELEKDFDAVAACALELMREKRGTFKVFARRSDKRFPMNSMEIQREIGAMVLKDNQNLTVDVHKPLNKLSIEIRDNAAYVYVDEVPAVGGMPMGTGGKAMLLLSGGIDSPVAGFQIMRRGVKLHAVHFFSHPYTGERAKEKVIELLRILGEYGGDIRLYVVPFTEIQLEIHQKCPEGLGTVLMRRYMMRIAERLARQYGAQALITGENLGQVASQTMEAIYCTDNVCTMPVFRPLIGLDKLEITHMAESIGTYQTSILPYEDCCTIFTPRHPTTKPKLPELIAAEVLLDSEALIERAIADIEIINQINKNA